MSTVSTQNVDIDYVVKDYFSTEDALITFATTQFGPGTTANRLWTDFNLDSFSRNWLDIVAFISDVFFFYFDQQATQNYLQTATVASAVANIAKQFGFVPSTATSATGSVTLTFSSAGIAPRGSRLQASNGSVFYLTTDVVASVAGNYSGSVIQGQLNTENFTAVGLQNEQFNLKAQNIVVDLTNLNPLDISPQVTVNGNAYTLINTFIYSNGTDLPAVLDTSGNVIGGGGRVYTLNKRADGTQYLQFGDGTFGRKVLANESVVINYRTGGGSSGNVDPNTIVTMVDTFSFVSSVTNAKATSGGTDAETIAQLQQLIPGSLRTLERAVTNLDYSELLTINFPQVQDASTEANTSDPGVDINVYVVPSGATITKITDNVPLKNTLTNFLNIRKMVTVQFQILDAFGVGTLIAIEAHLSNTASKSVVSQSIISALQGFFNLQTGGPSGAGLGFAAQILTEDIESLLKTIIGIDRFELRKLTYRPRLADSVIGLTTSYNSSNIDIFKNVSESEWMLAAAGPVTEATGTLIFHNTNAATFTYTSGTGKIQFTSSISPETLAGVAPGDLLRSGPGSGSIDATILSVDSKNNILYIPKSLTFDTTPAVNGGGSVRQGSSALQSFKCFKKINAIATNLSVNSITDTNIDFSIATSTGVALAPTVLLDNTQAFVLGQYATGAYYLVDAMSNIWEIIANDSDTLTTSLTAVNDASVSTVASGAYKIVNKLTSSKVIFNGNIFSIQYNNHNTLFSIGAQFSNIGTIGNSFQISRVQSNVGRIGVGLNLISYDPITKIVQLNNQPDLSGINSNDFMIDSSGQVFRLTGIDNRLQPSIAYDNTHYNTDVILSGVSSNSVLAQGFKVSQAAIYPIVSWYLKKQGNIAGNLIAQIVNDSAGLPNLASVVATANLINVSNLGESYSKTVFSFATPPLLIPTTQYHLIIKGDTGYNTIQKNNVKTFDNDLAAIGYTYTSISGVVQYTSSVGLSSVLPGNFIKDKVGNIFKVLAVNVAGNAITIATGATFVDDSPFSANVGSGSIFAKDNVYIGFDSVTPTYPDGAFETYNGSIWAAYSPASDAIFSVEGPNSITVNSNLTPVLGSGATVSSRYYDDNNEISLILGISTGLPTYATDVNDIGRGTVSAVPNSKVDTFVFRSSPYTDDIINLRANEIPQLAASDINLQLFGGTT